jgi:serine/threonine-protein kinase
MTSWVGRSLSGVRIQEQRDRGPIYDSYHGQWETTHQPVTVRIFHANLEDDQAALDLLRITSRLLSSMVHPNIARVFRLDVENGQPYLLQEPLANISMNEYLRKISERGLLLPIHIVARLFNPIASAIDYAHARGILHRNLNPSNIILRPIPSKEPPSFPLPAQFSPIVANFSLDHILGTPISIQLDSAHSDPSYLSPEQLSENEVDKRADIYALGILLYEMISGSPPEPLPAPDPVAETPHAHPRLGNVQIPVASAVQRAISSAPDKRFQRAVDLADAVEMAAGFKPGSLPAAPDLSRSSPPPTLVMKAPPRSRERLIALVFTALVVILGLATLSILAYLASRFLGNLGQTLPPLIILGSASLIQLNYMGHIS